MFQEILVVDYITDFSTLSADQIGNLISGLSDPHFLNNCPNGTIIGIPIARGSPGFKRVYFPFLSHISLPVKAGERAWGFDQENGLPSYWITRKVQNKSAEDPNFTHDDRARIFSALGSDPSKRQTVSRSFYDENASGKKLSNVRLNANSRSEFTGEPTVSLRAKSVDLAFQGSNNTAIKLGNNGTTSSGTIDIVAGIGTVTSLETIQNTDGYTEAVKPVSPATSVGSTPGDLSSADSSRIIVSQLFNADSYYELSGDSAGARPTISLKTDCVRIVAQNDMKIIVGNSSDPSSIVLKSNGDIIITPSSLGIIKLGGDDANGAILATVESVVTNGKVEAPSIVSTAGGLLGAPELPATGIFSTKVLVKVT